MAKVNSMELTTDTGEVITVVVVPFESVEAYEIIGKLEAKGGRLSSIRKEILQNTYVVRNDAKGERTRIDLCGPNADNLMNKAFKGTGIVGLGKAIRFAQEVNYADFLAEAARERAALAAAKEHSTADVEPSSD